MIRDLLDRLILTAYSNSIRSVATLMRNRVSQLRKISNLTMEKSHAHEGQETAGVRGTRIRSVRLRECVRTAIAVTTRLPADCHNPSPWRSRRLRYQLGRFR